MPKLIALYIRQIFVGFGLSAVFVGVLLYTNVANLGHLVSTSDIGWVAVAMLFMFNGLVFSGVQFAITVMRMGDEDNAPRGGRRVPVATDIPVRVEATATADRRQRR